MGAKRAVEGRSRSYDDLYLEWQRINNPNFKEPAGKKEREQRRAEKKERERQVADENKRKRGATWVDDDGFDEDGEEGKREMAELIQVARVAGQRLCPTTSGSVWISVIGGGFSGVGPSMSSISGDSSKDPSGASLGRAGAANGSNGAGGVGGKSNGNGNVIWRAGNYEFAQVGDMLTKALAARPKSAPLVVPPKITVNQGQRSFPAGMSTGGAGGAMGDGRKQVQRFPVATM